MFENFWIRLRYFLVTTKKQEIMDLLVTNSEIKVTIESTIPFMKNPSHNHKARIKNIYAGQIYARGQSWWNVPLRPRSKLMECTFTPEVTVDGMYL